ncbi:MAG: 3-dehydroquinate synthase [Lachnospiraceae bacterium]|nr:3-dehydroquinate synthase [Lachnospiraceae bacterium]
MKNYKSISQITVKTQGNEPYDILLRKSFEELPNALEKLGCPGHRVCIVTDSTVAPLYLDEVTALVKKACSQVEVFEFPAGERSKTLATIQLLYEKLILSGFDRKDYLLALGGGVTGDMTGYAAATFLRGIRFIQVPTTLLAQVDSSIGGKTGVDFDQYKNMVGAFHQPSLVYMNIGVLKSLPDEQFSNGMAELLKHGIIFDDDFYEWTIEHMSEIEDRDIDTLTAMVARSCQLKQYIVEKDPEEKGDRALLNFGHTIGHAIEKLKDFQMLHGECVSLGMVAAAYISWMRGMIDENEFYEIRDMNVAFGLPITFDGLSSQAVLEATKKDKKMDAGKIKFVLLKKLGRACVDRSVTDEEILQAVNYINAEDVSEVSEQPIIRAF